MGLGISADDETTGVDFTQHAETPYAEALHGYQPSRRLRGPRRPKKDESSRKLNRAARVAVEPSRVLVPAPASTRAVAVRPELQRHQQMPLDVTPELVAPMKYLVVGSCGMSAQR
jgi:hypothetical protein